MRRVVLIAGLSAVAVIGAVWFVNKYYAVEAHALAVRIWPSPTLQQFEASRLRHYAGWFSHDCGIVPRRRDPAEAIQCAQESLRSHRPFRVAFEWVGIDSRGITGIAGDSSGEIYEVTTDETSPGNKFFGTRPARTVTVVRCQEPPVEISVGMHGDRIMSCVDQPSGGGVSE